MEKECMLQVNLYSFLGTCLVTVTKQLTKPLKIARVCLAQVSRVHSPS